MCSLATQVSVSCTRGKSRWELLTVECQSLTVAKITYFLPTIYVWVLSRCPLDSRRDGNGNREVYGLLTSHPCKLLCLMAAQPLRFEPYMSCKEMSKPRVHHKGLRRLQIDHLSQTDQERSRKRREECESPDLPPVHRLPATKPAVPPRKAPQEARRHPVP